MSDSEAKEQPDSQAAAGATRDSGATLEIDFRPELVVPPRRPPENYYRRMMRRRAPWFVVVALFLVWAHGIVMGQLNREPSKATPGNLAACLLYFDRNLKMEENAAGRNALLRWVVDDSDITETLDLAEESLVEYEKNGFLDEEGLRALAVIREALDSPQEDLSPVDDLTAAVLEQENPEPDLTGPLVKKLDEGDGRWWDKNLAERMLAVRPDSALATALDRQHAADERIFLRTAAGYGAVALLPLLGLIWVPHTLRVLRQGWTIASLHRPVRYGSRWEPSLVVALLIAADLLAGYFYQGAYAATSDMPTGFIFDLGVDTVWRLFAPGLALVILFRKPGHAIRSLGLNTPVSWRVVFATYAVVSWANYGFSMVTDGWAEFDPTGGLDLMESGWGGLFYGLLSACILAPIAEEVFYRGILLRGLERRFGFWISASVVSIAFALGHFYDVFGLVSVGFLGFVMVMVYRATGSLTTIIVLHALYNLTITLPQWLLYYS